jgi:acetoin utilization protein AcuB
MLVKDIMQLNVACVRPETVVEEVVRLLQHRGVRHLPVLHHEDLVGIISDRDLKSILPGPLAKQAAVGDSAVFGGLTAGNIMTRHVITVEPTTSVEDAARLLMEKRIGALPVTVGRELVGIVTETDVLMLFVRAMGVLEPSSRLDVLLTDAPASLSRVVHTIESAGAAISSIVTLSDPSLRRREAVVRISTINPVPAIQALEAEGYVLTGPKRVAPHGAGSPTGESEHGRDDPC